MRNPSPSFVHMVCTRPLIRDYSLADESLRNMMYFPRANRFFYLWFSAATKNFYQRTHYLRGLSSLILHSLSYLSLFIHLIFMRIYIFIYNIHYRVDSKTDSRSSTFIRLDIRVTFIVRVQEFCFVTKNSIYSKTFLLCNYAKIK